MIAFIDDHRGVYGVEPICRVLPIAPSTYHAHVARRGDPAKTSPRARQDLVLMEGIRQVHAANFGVYGARKVWRQLGREGIAVARCTVERLMRSMGLRGVVRGKEIRTTIADNALPCPADKVNRHFRAPHPNALWVSDFTYVATWQGFVHAACHRRLRPPYRRLAGLTDGSCGLCPRCPGTSPARPPPCEGGPDPPQR